MARSALTKRLQACREKRQRGKDKYRVDFPALKGLEGHTLSNNLKAKGGYKQDKMRDHLWKKGRAEKTSTVTEMERKAKRVAIQTNKGNYSYITPESDPKCFGRK